MEVGVEIEEACKLDWGKVFSRPEKLLCNLSKCTLKFSGKASVGASLFVALHQNKDEFLAPICTKPVQN
jgi:hypothetical protein